MLKDLQKQKRHYTHDCKGCIYLGSFYDVTTYNGHAIWDLYISLGSIPTVIARHGNDGPDYNSWDVVAGIQKRSCKAIVEEYNRAVNEGLVKPVPEKTDAEIATEKLRELLAQQRGNAVQ